jgi:hypothetical protein
MVSAIPAHRPRPDARSPRPARPSVSLWPLIVYIAVVLFDPFGLYSTSNDVSQRFAYRLIALQEHGPEDRFVSVVLLDEPSARALNGPAGYPIRFEAQAAIIQSVLCRGPATLFIDLAFRDIRSLDPGTTRIVDGQTVDAELAALASALRHKPDAASVGCPMVVAADGVASHAQPRVFLARTRSGETPAEGCDPLFDGDLPAACAAARQLAILARASRPLTLARTEPDGTYLIAVPASRTFPDPPTEADQRFPREPSPALAAVLAFCADLPALRAAAFKGCRDRDALAALLESETVARLSPVWGYYRTPRPASLAAAGPTGCHPAQTVPREALWAALAETARQFVRGQPWLTDGPFGQGLCIPTETIAAAPYIELQSCGASDPAACRESQAYFTGGRMVFYGASVEAVHDLVDSPVLGRVPGVALHAMAATHLLRYGADYVREPPMLLDTAFMRLSWSQVVELSLALLSFAVVLGLAHATGINPSNPGFWSATGWFVAALALASVFTIAAYVWLGWTPANWLTLSLGLFGIMRSVDLQGAEKRVVHQAKRR